jgi:hypothetical protein
MLWSRDGAQQAMSNDDARAEFRAIIASTRADIGARAKRPQKKPLGAALHK